MGTDPDHLSICQRIEQVRRELHGPRGKAAFCRQLGISPSTYNYYETDRVPPADVLVRIADAGGADLRWLLTGLGAAPTVPADHPAVGRIAELLADHPDAIGPLTAFVDLLSASLAWPEKRGSVAVSAPAEAASPGTETKPPSARIEVKPSLGSPTPAPQAEEAGAGPDAPRRKWIPILGRSAAGVPQFWSNADEARGVTVLAELISRHARRRPASVVPAAAESAGRDAGAAQIIALTSPDPDDAAEFVVAPDLADRFEGAFAVRIDGDSMSPDIAHGDVVVCSPALSASAGQAAIVQLRNQIGVTCKLYRREGDTVHLIPVNDRYEVQTFPAGQVIWALRVLARIRPH